jgi:hypothetical protein
LSLGSGEEAAVECLFCKITDSGRLFEERTDFEEVFEERRGFDVVHRYLAEQPALRSWLLFCRREVRSIAPANAVCE